MKTRIALIVPEYRTELAPGGGVSTVADFLYDAFSVEPNWEVEIVSPRTSHKAEESQRLGNPKSWLRGITTSRKTIGEKDVTYVGSRWAEFEFFRYLPRRALTDILEQFDALVIVCGTPAVMNLIKSTYKPSIAQVATTIQLERAMMATKGSKMRRLYSRFNNFFIYQLDKRGIKIPQMISVENPWMENWSKEHGSQNTSLDIPGVDTQFFSPSTVNELKDPINGEGYIVSVGRLNEVRKDYALLLRSYALAVKKHHINQKLVIAGRGDLNSDIYELMDKLEIRERVEVRRNLSLDGLRDAYRGADLFVMSSSEEGLGLVLIEALSCGTPIVSTATEGAKSVVTSAGVGALINFGADIESDLADSIALLAKDPAERSSQSKLARESAIENFGFDASGLKFRKLLLKAMTEYEVERNPNKLLD